MSRRVFMRFLYRGARDRLENLCVRWHLSERLSRGGSARRAIMHWSYPMLDILMLALAFGFFALAFGYTYACERL